MKYKYLILLLCSILSIITFLDRNALSIAGTRITNELGLSDSAFGWILTAFTISYGLMEIPMGMWGDKFGEKKVIIRIVFWWSVFTALTGLAGGFISLFFIRFLFGAGEAGAYPNIAIAIKKWFPAAERGRAQSYIWMASRIGGALAPLIVVPLQIHYGWRMTFLFLGVLGIIWVIIWWLLYPEKSINENQNNLKIETSTLRTQLRNKSFWLLMLMYYSYACGVFFFISWLPKYLQSGRNILESDLAYSASLPFFLAAFGCWSGGWLSDYLVKKLGNQWGRKLVPIIGLSLSGLVILLAHFSLDNIQAVVLLALGLALMDVTAPVSWAIATDLGKESSGAVTGAMNTAGLLGGSIASLGIGYLVTWTGSYDLPVIFISIQLFAGALFAFGLKISEVRTSND